MEEGKEARASEEETVETLMISCTRGKGGETADSLTFILHSDNTGTLGNIII
jgi:hypothetical protein